ncbi:MAG: MBL fold metallo-hydrolase, partial [Pseudomonadales bacterium]
MTTNHLTRLILGLLALGLSLGLGACQSAERTTPASATNALRLYVFDCGQITAKDISMFGISNDQTDVRTLFVPCYLIEHPQGRMVFDLGLPEAVAGAGTVPYGDDGEMRYDRSLVQQLADLSLTPNDIDWVSYSHSHFDHVGSANRFANATLLLQEA